jgi:hypothetical protein
VDGAERQCATNVSGIEILDIGPINITVTPDMLEAGVSALERGDPKLPAEPTRWPALVEDILKAALLKFS